LQQQEFYSAKGEKIRLENYFPSGQLAYRVGFANDREEGEAILYHENGKPQEIRYFSKGRLHGTRTYFDAEGNLLSTETYEFGNKINK
jgi:antitoxin component YwqK of YwqJK toxin-antitoxin module